MLSFHGTKFIPKTYVCTCMTAWNDIKFCIKSLLCSWTLASHIPFPVIHWQGSCKSPPCWRALSVSHRLLKCAFFLGSCVFFVFSVCVEGITYISWLFQGRRNNTRYYCEIFARRGVMHNFLLLYLVWKKLFCSSVAYKTHACTRTGMWVLQKDDCSCSWILWYRLVLGFPYIKEVFQILFSSF